MKFIYISTLFFVTSFTYASQNSEILKYSDFGISIKPPAGWKVENNNKASKEFIDANKKYGNDPAKLSKVSIVLFKASPIGAEGKNKPSLFCVGMLANVPAKLLLLHNRSTWVKREKGATVSEIKSHRSNGLETYEFDVSKPETKLYAKFSALNNNKKSVICGANGEKNNKEAISSSLKSLSKL